MKNVLISSDSKGSHKYLTTINVSLNAKTLLRSFHLIASLEFIIHKCTYIYVGDGKTPEPLLGFSGIPYYRS